MPTDIQTQEDIKIIVDRFYEQVRKDPLLAPLFDLYIQDEWELHLPRMYAFWETVLLGRMVYKGNPALKHLIIHKKTPLTQQHFDRWLTLWQNTLDQHYTGRCVETAKERAHHMSRVLQAHINP
ncbi:MAG: group III truncated hemoglobin [Flavobacteriaceae bacterium]